MPSGNKITVYGHVGRDPELKFTPQGLAICTFSLPSDDRKKDKNGEWVTVTTWFRVTAFGKTAENSNKYLKKGKLVMVHGKVRMEEYTDKEGNKRTSLEVTADDVVFLSKDSGEDPLARPFIQNREAAVPPAPDSKVEDEDIPF